MTNVLVDSNVILDVLTEDPHWFDWSAAQLAACAETGTLDNLCHQPQKPGFFRPSLLPTNKCHRNPVSCPVNKRQYKYIPVMLLPNKIIKD